MLCAKRFVTNLLFPMFRTVEFLSTFASEWQFDASGNPVAPGARELADAIANKLGKRMNVVLPVELHSYFGWAFEVAFGGCRFINVLNPGNENCYFTIKLCWYGLRTLLLQRLRRKFDEYCIILENVLAEIPPVSSVVWKPPWTS